MPVQNPADPEIETVASAVLALDPTGIRTARVIRETMDQLYDGQRSGRYRWDQLHKTEKTHCGTLVEINLQRKFKYDDGVDLDYRIGDIEVDCKYSQRINGWMIPPEAIGHICMLVWSEDIATPTWSLGLIRVVPDILNKGKNRDGKKSLNKEGQKSIKWIWKNAPLPPNILLQMNRADVDRIMNLKSGAKRLNELFRCAQGKLVGRGVVATVCQQEDYMRRVRESGGSRTPLKEEGIIILGQYQPHQKIALALGIPIPRSGESISVRVVRASAAEANTAEIENARWRVAGPGDPVVVAPRLPSTKKNG